MAADKKTIEKEKIIKEDGRYIFFYKFKDERKNDEKNKGQKKCRR